MISTATILILSDSLRISVDLQVDKQEIDVGEVVTFNIIHSGPIQEFIYLFHDGGAQINTQSDQIQHSFSFEGIYLVTVIGVGIGEIIAQDTIEIKVKNRAPQVKISSPLAAQEDQEVELGISEVVDTANDLPSLRYQWVLGDGHALEGESVTYSWVNAGQYPITLYAFDDQNATGYDVTFINIVNVPPNAAFTTNATMCSDQIFVEEDQVIQFNASATIDTPSDLDKLRYFWDFGDGAVGRGRVITHAYSTSGGYQISLTVLDDDNSKSSCVKSVYVTNVPPQVTLTPKNISVFEGASSIFKADAVDTPTDFERLHYFWSFGQEGWQVSHAWKDDWNGTVSVSVQDPEGAIDTDNISVQVLNVPPSIQLDSAYLNTNLTITVEGYSAQIFELNIYEAGYLIANTMVKTEKGWSSPVSSTLPLLFDLSKSYQVEVKYSNGTTPSGWHTVTLTYAFSAYTCYSLTHTFDYGHRDPWVTNPAALYPCAPISFKGNIFDPGMDDINASIQLKTYINLEIDFFLASLLNILGFFPFSCEFDLTSDTRVKVDGWITEDEIIHVAIESWTNLTTINYDNEGVWPVTLPLTATCQIPNLDFLNLIDMVNIKIFGFTILEINVTRSDTFLEAYATDEDGGTASFLLEVVNSRGQLFPVNLAPKALISGPSSIWEDDEAHFSATILHNGDLTGGELIFWWNFGDGQGAAGQEVTHSFPYAGDYLIQLTVIDSQNRSSTQGFLLRVENKNPAVVIYGIFKAEEDSVLEFEANCLDTASDTKNLRIYWDFGDGLAATGSKTTHSYAKAGMYHLQVEVIDDNNGVGLVQKIVEIIDSPPKIVGPFGFDNTEGTTTLLEVSIEDSTLDELALSYSWLFEGVAYNSRRMAIWKDDGFYTAQLTVIDSENRSISANIGLNIQNTPPICFTTKKILYGAPSTLELTAYGVDSFVDMEELNYSWTLDDQPIPNGQGASSTIEYKFVSTKNYQWVTCITDDTPMSCTSPFTIQVFMDSDGDGLSNEMEAVLETSPDKSDSDNDFITDWYEFEIYKTNPNVADTDNDGLLDGYDPIINAGELTLGTNPRDPDTDDDLVLDGPEVLGWNITVNGASLRVFSNPLIRDSDNDGLTDGEEYNYWVNQGLGLNPASIDTDGDGISDFDEIQAGSRPDIADSDQDGLSDYQETQNYTIVLKTGETWTTSSNPLEADSDGDGLIDSEERMYGNDYSITDANDPDTDHDGLLDGEESYEQVFSYPYKCALSRFFGFYFGIFSIPGVTVPAIFYSTSLTISCSSEIPSDYQLSLWGSGPCIYTKQIPNCVSFYETTDITDFLKTHPIPNPSTWVLYISSSQPALLEEFKINIVEFVDPTDADSDNDGLTDGAEIKPNLGCGWITNPNNDDTDGDTLLDAEEINILGTNPLSPDTDGDGVTDAWDIDPFHNLMLKIYVDKFTDGRASRTYTHALNFQFNIAGQNLGFVTEHKVATEDWKDYYTWVGISHVHIYGFLTSVFHDTYYIDISDDISSIPSNQMNVSAWTLNLDVPPYNGKDKYLYTEPFAYTIGGLGHSQSYTLVSSAEPEDQKIYFTITTIGLQRINPLTIYTEDIFQNGHFSHNEQFISIYLEIQDTPPSDSPFKRGINVILIPISLFLTTKLHSILELKTDGSELPNALRDAEFLLPDRAYKSGITKNLENAIIKGDRAVSYSEAAQILELILTDSNNNPLQDYQITCTTPETLGLPVDILKNIPNKAISMSPTGDPPDDIWEPPWWMAFWLIFLNVIFPGVGLLLFGGFIVMGAFIQCLTALMSNANGLTSTRMTGLLSAIQRGINKIAKFFMDSVKKILELGRIFLLTKMATQIRPIVRELGGEVTMTSDSIRFSLDGLFYQTKIDFEEQYDQKLNTNIPLINFKASSNDGTEMQSSQSLMISPRISRNTPIHSVAEAISARWGINFLGLFRYIKNPTVAPSELIDIKNKVLQNKESITQMVSDHLDSKLFNKLSFAPFDNYLKGLDSSYTNRFESLIDVDFLKNHWNYFTPCANLYEKRIGTYNPKFFKNLFENQNLITSSIISKDIENFASQLNSTYFPSPSFPNLQYEYTKQKADLPELLKTMNTISVDMENPNNNFSLIPSIVYTEKEGLKNNSQELIKNCINLIIGSSYFDKTIEKVLLLAELNKRLTFNSRDDVVKTNNDILSHIQEDYWRIWGVELCLLHVDLLDGVISPKELKLNALVTIVTISLGILEFIFAFDLMEKSIQLDPSITGVNEGYKQEMIVRAYFALGDSIRRVIFGGAELVFEAIFRKDDTVPDGVAFVLFAYDLITDIKEPIPDYLNITEQSAISLFDFEKVISILMGIFSQLSTNLAQKVNIYAGLAAFTGANICLTIRGMRTAYLFNDQFMFWLILVLCLLGV